MIEIWQTGVNALRKTFQTLTDTHPVPDALVVLGSGLRIDPQSPNGVSVSWDSKMRLHATRLYYEELSRQGHKPHIIFCGGDIYPGLKPVAWYNQAEFREQIPQASNSLVRFSTSTVDDIRHAKRQMRKLGLKNAVVISNEYHLSARAAALSVGADYAQAEDIIFHQEPESRDDLARLAKNPLVQRLKRRQIIGLAMLLMPGGKSVYDFSSHRTADKRAVPTSGGPNPWLDTAFAGA